MKRTGWMLGLVAVLAAGMVVGCGGRAPEGAEATGHGEHEHASADAGRVAIPPPVRRNLGITFAKVERRRIERTLRVPGRFEYQPTARREYRTMLPGRVELLVEQFARVEAGEPLYRIDSPAWREMQQQLAETSSAIRRLAVRLETFDPLREAHERHERSLEESVAVWSERVAQLESARDAGGGRVGELAEARSALAAGRAELAEVQETRAELEAQRSEAAAELESARARLSFLLDAASAFTGVDRAAIAEDVTAAGETRPRWATIGRIEVASVEPGVVEEFGLTNGAWADERTPVLTVVRPERLRFRASALQSDLGALRDGLGARIVPPTPTLAGRAVPMSEAMAGTVALGPGGDAGERTIDLFVVPERLLAWARPGVAAQLEIVTDASGAEELAIPLAAVQRDGLTPVIFRRDPRDPDKAIRVEADLGVDDGRWVAVLSGLRDGDEVVLDGAFQLMLATSGSVQRGGHFHADGTFHEGED